MNFQLEIVLNNFYNRGSNMEFAFTNIPLPTRPVKPRTSGQTMMIDWGIPYGHQLDILESQGHLVDEAKFAASLCRIMPKDILIKKNKAYQDHNIFTFPGGLFTELAIAQNNYEKFLEEVIAMGFSGIEVSDNLIDISLEKKVKLIEKAKKEFGLKVMGEVGKKDGIMTGEEIIEDSKACVEAGCKMVLLEAHELFHGDVREDVIDELSKVIPAEKIMWELPLTVLPDVAKHYKTKIMFWMVSKFGTNVNLANVENDEVYFLEMARNGASGDRTHKDGAYARAGMSSDERA
jgi:phosphosulfolactate synthase